MMPMVDRGGIEPRPKNVKFSEPPSLGPRKTARRAYSRLIDLAKKTVLSYSQCQVLGDLPVSNPASD